MPIYVVLAIRACSQECEMDFRLDLMNEEFTAIEMTLIWEELLSVTKY